LQKIGLIQTTLNLPDNEDLAILDNSETVDKENPWKLPKDYIPTR
jgi:hypothetical protein